MGLETTASLIVAAFELSAVRLIRDAIRTADLSSGRGQSATPLGPDPNPVFAGPAGPAGSGRFSVHPEPVYEPRRHIHPTPHYEQRTVYYTVRHEARFEQADNDAARACPLLSGEHGAPASSLESPIPPVWTTLPPVEHPAPPERIRRVIRQHTNAVRKGLVVDVHV